jgi:hypothetical protein
MLMILLLLLLLQVLQVLRRWLLPRSSSGPSWSRHRWG